MTKTQKTQAKKILDALSKQQFADWYNEGGGFDTWISGIDAQTPQEEQDEKILNDIVKLFSL